MAGPAMMVVTAASGRSTDGTVAAVALAVAAVVGAAWAARRLLARRRSSGLRRGSLALGSVLAVAGVGAIVALAAHGGSSSASATGGLAANPKLDPGSPLSGSAPGFTLTNQFGKPVSLRAFRGKVVLLAFTDSECTTVCPLTTSAMLQARAMLGAAGSRVALVGVDANPRATSVRDAWSYSQLHGMLHAWDFLTGSLSQLRSVWRSYAIDAQIEHGQIDHTPALFVIGPDGQEAKLYMTQLSYAAVGQLGQLLAREAAHLLPGHPGVRSALSYAPVPGIGPGTRATVPRAGGGTVVLGPGAAHLQLFFASWDREVTDLGRHLDALNAYATAAVRSHLPALTGVDETSVEPSAGAVSRLLAGLPRPLSYPVALDRSGRVADGYEVQDAPWFVLTSAGGRILWSWDVATAGWPSQAVLAGHVRAALARGPAGPASAAAAARELAGSPPPLDALHRQSSQIIGDTSALTARIRALRGYPIVVNAWASWCTACRAEFGLFAAASARFGRRVAFLGAVTDDPSIGDARSFLAQHPVSYPSYETSTASLQSLAVVEGLPTTIFLDRQGRRVAVHTGQYQSIGSLDADISALLARR